MSSNRITFVIPARNNRRLIGPTLDAIANQTFRDWDCWVIDGHSTDGMVEFIRENYPWVRVVLKATDSGPGASRSIGMLTSDTPFVALVDSDVQLEPTWAERQLELMSNNARIGVCGSKLLYAASPTVLFSAHGAMNRYGVSWDGGQGEPADEFNESRQCIWANTSSLLIRREAIQKAGAFDDLMFAFCEDSDFGWRVNLCGFDIVYNPEAVAVHVVHGSFDPVAMDRTFIYLVRRNRIRSLLVNYGLKSLVRYVLPYVVLAIGESTIGPLRWLKLRAVLWNIVHLPNTLLRRRRVQSLRTVSDDSLWHLFEEGIRGPGGDSMVRLKQGSDAVIRREQIS